MKNINIGQVIQIVANVGVIAGIVFLGYELRQNSEALDAQARYNHAEARSSFLFDLAANDDISSLIVKAQQGQELDTLEKYKLHNVYLSMLATWQWEFGEGQLGRISAPVTAWQRLIREIPTDTGWYYPGLRQAWESNKNAFLPDFIAFLDQLLADSSDD